jgi:hypothetical protein
VVLKLSKDNSVLNICTFYIAVSYCLVPIILGYCLVLARPALESKLLSRICESDGGAQFSSIPSSRYSPGTPGQAGIVRETPERTDTDTPTFNGDFKKTHMVVRMTTLPLYIMVLS